MPNINIHTKLITLKVDIKIKEYIKALEAFIEENKAIKLSDLLSPDQIAFQKFQKKINLFNDSDKVFNTIASEIPRSSLITEISKLKEDIKKNYAFLNKTHMCFSDLDKAKKNLEREMKKTLDTQDESKIGEAENTLKKYTTLVLEEQIKKNNKNFVAAIKLYNLNSFYPLCIARYIWLNEQSIHNQDYLEAIENLIKQRINAQAKADITGSSHLVSGIITLLDLVKIKNWNSFKLDFGKQLNALRTEKNEAAALINKTSDTSTEENSNLLKEINELKEKITNLEAELSDAQFKFEENKLTTEATNSNITTSDFLKDQNDKKITDLNKRLLAVNEKNEQLITEIERNKELNLKQQQNISNLSDELASLKTELEAKEKQVVENSSALKQREDQLNQQEKELIKNKSALEKSSHEIKQLSGELANTSKKLEEQNKTLNQKEIELNVLSNEKSKIESEIQRLKDALQENQYTDGLIKLKEDEIAKLSKQLNQSNEQFHLDKSELTSNAHTNNLKISLLESNIKEKELYIEKLKNELDNSKKIVSQNKYHINSLNKDLELKEQELNQSQLQVQTIAEQSKHLSDLKNTLEQKYKAKLADFLTKYNTSQAQLLSTRQELEEKLNSLQEKNIHSEIENQELKKHIESFKMSLENEKTTLLKAEMEISELRETLSSAQGNLASTNQNFNAQLEATKAEKKDLIKKYDLFISEADKILYNITDKDSEILFSSTPTNNLTDNTNEFNRILTKIRTLKEQVDESDALKDKIYQLNLSQHVLENENTKQLSDEIEALKNQIHELLEKNESLKEQNENLIMDLNHGPIPIEKNFEEEYDEFGYQFDTVSIVESLDDDAEIKGYKSFPKTLEELDETKNNLKKSQEELLELQNQLKEKEIELINLKTKMQDKTKHLTEAQASFKESREQIEHLKAEQTELMENNASNQQTIAKQIEELDKLKLHYKDSIQELNKLRADKKTHLKDLSSKLNFADQQVQELNQTLNSIETDKVTLETKLTQLEQKNDELQQKLNQAYVKDTQLTELEQEKLLIEKELEKVQNKLKDLEKRLEINQTAYSESEEEYAKLKKTFEEQSQKLNLITADYRRSHAQLEETRAKLENLNPITTDSRQRIQDHQLSSLKKEVEYMKDGDLNPQFGKPIVQEEDLGSYQDPTSFAAPSYRHSDSSSGHSSIASSTPELNEDESLTGFLTSQEKIPQQPLSSDEGFSDGSSSESKHRSASPKHPQSEPNLMQFSNDEDSKLSETEDELTKSTDSRPSTSDNIHTPTSEQQGREATLEEVKQGVNAAFKQNHQAIIDALIDKFLQIATDTANNLSRENVKQTLPNFEPELKKIASAQITKFVFPYINSLDYKTQISTKIHRDKLKASNYLEEIINLTKSIFASLQINEFNQSYKDNIADQVKTLLFKLCTEKLQTNEKENLVKLAKENLKSQAAENKIQVTEYSAIIQRTAEELVTKLLETKNLQKVLKETASQPFDEANLLIASQQRLQDQLVQQIRHNFVDYFPNLHLDPILDKINDDKALSDEEIAKFPPELQYAETLEEFASGLRVKYPNLSPRYENKIDEGAFKKLRLQLRKKALNALPLATFEDKEILDLRTKNWLEKKLQNITKKSFSLKLDKKDQKDLDNNFQKYFTLSSLEDMAITHKSTEELKNELKKLRDFKFKTVTELSKTFLEIEQKLKAYPNLITEDDTFQANLNNSLPLNFPKLSNAKYPKLSDTQIQILLDKINQHLENDVSKWRLLNNDKIAQEIANDIISDPTNNPFDSETDIQKLVSDSLTILYKFHGLQDTVEKRKHWDSEIQQLYALAQKLKSSSHFNQTIEDRICKLEEMLDLKKNDADENVKALPKGVYLPQKCRVIPNFEFDSTNLEEFHLHVGDFYKQEALNVGKTITFSQKLSNEDHCKWSATLNTDKCLSFKTQKKRFRREKSYLQEVSFAQMVYSVNSFKDAKTCTLNFGNCSQNMKERLYLFAKAYNELRVEDSELQKRPKINCNIKNPPNLDKSKIAAVKEEIKAQLNLHTHELEDISTKLKDDTMIHQIIRSRG